MNEVDWASPGGPEKFPANKFSTRTVHDYLPERHAPLKRQKLDECPAVPMFEPAVDLKQLPGVTRNTISDVDHDYWRYCGVVDSDGDIATDVPADVVDDFDYIFAQRALWETCSASCFTPGIVRKLPRSRSSFQSHILLWALRLLTLYSI